MKQDLDKSNLRFLQIFDKMLLNDQRRWVINLREIVRTRYTNTIKQLSTKSISLDTRDDILFLTLYYKAYNRILSFLPSQNPIYPIYEDELYLGDVEEILEERGEEINAILDDLFYLAEMISGNCDLEEYVKKTINRIQRNYPLSLFPRANQIFKDAQAKRLPGEGLCTYEIALEKALSFYEQYKHIYRGHPDFDAINSSYKKYRQNT